MSASAGAAAAADEGLAAAVAGEDGETGAAIVIVSRDPGIREILHRELSKRYGADYQVLACGRPGDLAAWVRDLRTAGLPVALVIGGGRRAGPGRHPGAVGGPPDRPDGAAGGRGRLG